MTTLDIITVIVGAIELIALIIAIRWLKSEDKKFF